VKKPTLDEFKRMLVEVETAEKRAEKLRDDIQSLSRQLQSLAPHDNSGKEPEELVLRAVLYGEWPPKKWGEL
jgi:predicted ATP-grasp superfamily ATP-dependent carboligase